MENLYLVVMTLMATFLGVALLYERKQHREEVQKLLDRLLARDLPELKAYSMTEKLNVSDEQIQAAVRDKVEEILNQGVSVG